MPTLSYQTSSVAAASASTAPASTTTNLQALEPRVTTPPDPLSTYTCCSTDELVVVISTTVSIHHFSSYYPDSQLAVFTPTYYTLNDGSLITPAFVADVRAANISIFCLSALAILFLRNIIKSASFIWLGKIKKKGLLYTLLASQLLAPIVVLPPLISFFDSRPDCTNSLLIATLALAISLGLIISGILGVKAYRCLENSRIVLAVICVLRASSLAITGARLPSLKGSRRLSGGCTLDNNRSLTFSFILIQLVETLFICGCFSYAIYKSHVFPAARGRISIGPIVDETRPRHRHRPTADTLNQQLDSRSGLPYQEGQGNIVAQKAEDADNQPRGWWDYVPNQSNHPTQPPAPSRYTASISSLRLNFRQRAEEWYSAAIGGKEMVEPSQISRKPSLAGDVPLPQPLENLRRSRENTLSNSSPNSPISSHAPSPSSPRSVSAPSRLLSSSRGSGLIRLIPRMELFKEVMKDELSYTAFVAASLVGLAVIIIVGMNTKLSVSISNWLLINWAFVSIVTIHSFSRVVARHEREALLQNPSHWEPVSRAERAFTRSTVVRNPYSLSSTSIQSSASSAYNRRERASTQSSRSLERAEKGNRTHGDSDEVDRDLGREVDSLPQPSHHLTHVQTSQPRLSVQSWNSAGWSFVTKPARDSGERETYGAALAFSDQENTHPPLASSPLRLDDGVGGPGGPVILPSPMTAEFSIADEPASDNVGEDGDRTKLNPGRWRGR